MFKVDVRTNVQTRILTLNSTDYPKSSAHVLSHGHDHITSTCTCTQARAKHRLKQDPGTSPYMDHGGVDGTDPYAG